MFEVKEVLRLWLRGEGLRAIERLARVDRKTVRRYVQAAVELGVDRGGGEGQLNDEVLAAVIERVRPHRTDGHGESWRTLEGHAEQIRAWLDDEGLTVVKVHTLLARQGVDRPRAHPGALLRRAVRAPAWPEEDRPRRRRRARRRAPGRLRAHGSHVRPRHRSAPGAATRSSSRPCVAATASCGSPSPRRWPTSSTASRRPGSSSAGSSPCVIPDNMAAIVDKANPTEPRLNAAFVEYAQDRGFLVDATRVRHPKDKPRVERAVPYVRGSFFAGEHFVDRARRPAPGRSAGARRRRDCGCTAPRPVGRPSTSPCSRLPSCPPHRSLPMTCRTTPRPRCLATTTSRWPRRSTRCRAT